MKTTKTAVILLALVLLTATGAQSAEKPAKKEISNTWTASCLVKITTDSSVLPLGIIAIDYLTHSSGVAGKAAREVLDISPNQVSRSIAIKEIESIDTGPYGDIGIPPEASIHGETLVRSITGRYTDRPTVPTRTTARTSTLPAAEPAAFPGTRTRPLTRRLTDYPLKAAPPPPAAGSIRYGP